LTHTVYSGPAVVTSTLTDSRLAFVDKRYFIFNKKTSCR